MSLSSEASCCFFQSCVYFPELCRLLYLMSDPGCARETSFRGLVDVLLKYGLFASGGSGISSYWPLLGLASSSEDEYESLIVREECGKDDEWSDNLWSRGEGRQWKSWGTPQPPTGPPERLLSGLSHLWSFCQEVWMREAVVLICSLLRRASGLREHSGFICRCKQVQISVS